MGKKRIQVLGICRWSYPGSSSGFRKAPKTFAEIRSQLYEANRMEHRLLLLEHLFLPALRRQSDPDFKLLMVMGEDLPQPLRARVLALIADVPQIVPRFEPEGQDTRQLCSLLMTEHREADVAAVAQFRLDDDDAVSVEFVRETRAAFEDVRPIYRRSGLFGLDFSRGFMLNMSDQGCEFLPVAARFWTPGMVVFISPKKKASVLDFHHLQLWLKMPTLIRMEDPMFVRGMHGSNDSNLAEYGRRARKFPFKMQELPDFMQRRFGIDVEAIQLAWADHISAGRKSA